jgi:hypothetical protein
MAWMEYHPGLFSWCTLDREIAKIARKRKTSSMFTCLALPPNPFSSTSSFPPCFKGFGFPISAILAILAILAIY